MIIIAVFAGLVVSCDVGIVGGFYEDSTKDLNEFIAIVMFTSRVRDATHYEHRTQLLPIANRHRYAP